MADGPPLEWFNSPDGDRAILLLNRDRAVAWAYNEWTRNAAAWHWRLASGIEGSATSRTEMRLTVREVMQKESLGDPFDSEYCVLNSQWEGPSGGSWRLMARPDGGDSDVIIPLANVWQSAYYDTEDCQWEVYRIPRSAKADGTEATPEEARAMAENVMFGYGQYEDCAPEPESVQVDQQQLARTREALDALPDPPTKKGVVYNAVSGRFKLTSDGIKRLGEAAKQAGASMEALSRLGCFGKDDGD